MRSSTANKLLSCQLVFTFCFLISSLSYAAGLDAPHNSVKFIGCSSCHDLASSEPKHILTMGHTPQNNDDTLFNNLCWSCHVSDDTKPFYVETHSSKTAGNNYGDWTVECWVCHNQHTQEQNQLYGSTYGKFIRTKIDLANITGSTKAGIKNIKLTAPSEFAQNDTVFEGICEVCHTATTHWSETALDSGNKHFSSLNCLDCHPHNQGMKAVPPDHAPLVPVPSFCQSCHTNTIFGLHNSSETGGVNCDRCHDKTDNYAFSGTLPLYLDAKLSWSNAKEKGMLTSGQARCDECHQGQYEAHIIDTGHGRLHDNSRLGYDLDADGVNDGTLACDACHFSDLIQEHSTRREIECSACHESTSQKVIDAINMGKSPADGGLGQLVFCNDCHDSAAGTPAGNLVANHHLTSYAMSGNCTRCHIVGPGERGPQRPPCWYCHGEGKPGDPKRAAVNKHVNGPAITDTGVDDFRVCFSCHLDGGQGFKSGVTPLVTPMHGLPGTSPDYTDVYWPYGYYRDASNVWQTPVPLMPTPTDPYIPADLENDPDRWLIYPGWHTLNYLGEIKKVQSSIYNDSTNPTVQDWARGATNSIRTLVDIGYMQQDYPTVPISMGGNFEVPSFDGTGTIGKPTGSGSVSVTISPAAAVAAGAQWRLDGGIWQDSATTLSPVSDRENHLLEFKLLAGWAEPQQIQIAVDDSQTTGINGPDATYTTCADNSELTAARTTGDTTLAFNWDKPEQVETFTVSGGWFADEVTCEIWKDTGTSLEEAVGFTARTSTGGDSCQLRKDDSTPAGTYNLILRMTGSSCFRNSTDLGLAVTVTPGGAPSPFGQAGGTITQPFLNSLALPTSGRHDLLHLAGDLYVHLNTSGNLSTFTIDSQGAISPVIASADLWVSAAGNGPAVKMVRVHDTLIALIYNTGSAGSQESHIMTVGIEQGGALITTLQDYLFHADHYSLLPRIYPHNDNSSLFIVTWIGYSNSPRITTAGLLTIQVNQSGIITETDRNLAMPEKGLNWEGNIIHVSGNKYGYVQSSDINIFEVNAGGTITVPTTLETYRFSEEVTFYGELMRVNGDIFVVGYTTGQSGIDAGVLKTIAINNSSTGLTFRTINSYLFEPCSSGYVDSPSLVALSDTIIGVSYTQYSSCDGQSGTTLKTIGIQNDGRITVPPLGTMELAGGGNVTPVLFPVSSDTYGFLLHNDISQGPSFSGVKTYTISHDNDGDGIIGSIDNCPDIANAGQADQDADGVGDACDNCPTESNAGQNDLDIDGIGDACDTIINPDQPVNISPADFLTIMPRRPVLAASPYNSKGGHSHQASQWKISTGSGAAFDANSIYDITTATDLETHSVTTDMPPGTTLYWKVRYQDIFGEWSIYSCETSFTYSYKRAVTLSPVTPTVDYQVKVELTTAGFDYTRAQADGSDIVFYDSGENELPHWVETWNPAGTSTIWVRVPAAGTATIYLAYGNAFPTSSSNGHITFEMYFEDVGGGSGNTPDLQNSDGFIIEASLTATALQSEGPQINFNHTGIGSEQTNLDYLKGGNLLRRFDYASDGTVSNAQNTSLAYPLNSATKWKIVVSNSSYWFYFDNILRLSETNLPYSHGGIWFGGWATGDAGIFHYLFVRKYTASEPVATVGIEM